MTDIQPIHIDLTGTVNIRLEGRPEDVSLLAAVLAAVLGDTNESRDYHNRGDSGHVRRYLSVGGGNER